MLLILFYDEKSIQGVFSVATLYNLVVTHLTFMVWLTNLLTVFNSEAPT